MVSRMRRALLVVGFVASTLVIPLSSVNPSNAALTVPNCQTGAIKVSIGQSNGAAGTIYWSVIFTNIGTSTCHLSGVPAIQPATTSQIPVGPPARSNSTGMMGVLITLAPKKSASVAWGVGETGNYTPATCGPARATHILVRLSSVMGTGRWMVSLATPVSVCTKLASTTTRLLSVGTSGGM
jgi:hypothetical protein